jgi:hypothetical protein
MLYSEIIAVCSQIHTKHINTLCGQKVELLSVKPGGTYSDHWALKGIRGCAASQGPSHTVGISQEGLCSVNGLTGGFCML